MTRDRLTTLRNSTRSPFCFAVVSETEKIVVWKLSWLLVPERGQLKTFVASSYKSRESSAFSMRRRTDQTDGRVIRILLVLSFILGLLMMVLGVVFRVYVCHWVAKAMFGGWIGIFVSIILYTAVRPRTVKSAATICVFNRILSSFSGRISLVYTVYNSLLFHRNLSSAKFDRFSPWNMIVLWNIVCETLGRTIFQHGTTVYKYAILYTYMSIVAISLATSLAFLLCLAIRRIRILNTNRWH